MDDTCTTIHVRHATTDQYTRALPTRGHTLHVCIVYGRPVNILRARAGRYT